MKVAVVARIIVIRPQVQMINQVKAEIHQAMEEKMLQESQKVQEVLLLTKQGLAVRKRFVPFNLSKQKHLVV